MTDDPKVWLSSKKQRNGPKRYYYLRWLDPGEGKWRNRAAGTDKRRAEGERVKLEESLRQGTYKHLRKITWADFVSEHCRLIPGDRHRDEAERILRQFGETFTDSPGRATFATVEGFADRCKAAGNSQATINKKLRYLRAAFNKAVRRGYAKANPMDGWTWTTAKRPGIRTASPEEQRAILAACKDRCGLRMWAFAYTALYTGGRKGELLGVLWNDIDLDAGRITFRDTKSHEDRPVPLTPGTVGVLRALRMNFRSAAAPGPFHRMGDIDRKWRDARGDLGLTMHDLRRTYITNLIRNGVPLPTVQRLAGHSKIQTTLEYYNATSEKDRRDAVDTLRPRRAAAS